MAFSRIRIASWNFDDDEKTLFDAALHLKVLGRR